MGHVLNYLREAYQRTNSFSASIQTNTKELGIELDSPFYGFDNFRLYRVKLAKILTWVASANAAVVVVPASP